MPFMGDESYLSLPVSFNGGSSLCPVLAPRGRLSHDVHKMWLLALKIYVNKCQKNRYWQVGQFYKIKCEHFGSLHLSFRASDSEAKGWPLSWSARTGLEVSMYIP